MIRKIKRKIKQTFGPNILKKMEVSGRIVPRIRRGKGMPCRRFDGLGLAEIEQKMEQGKDQIFQGFHSHDRVLIKVNLNTANPYPASTDLVMIEWVVKQLKDRGIHRIIVGDCSSNSELPTRKVMKEAGFFSRFGEQVEFACFDELEWVRVKGDFSVLPDLVVPRLVDQVDKIIYLANVKTHRHADFSLGMKLAVGFMHPLQRIDLHRDHLHEKVVEIAAAVQPDLIFLDGRKAFVDGGPNTGRVERGDCVIVGTDILQTELLGYQLLWELKKKFQCLGNFSEDPFEMKQLRYAKDIFLQREGSSLGEKR
jgi:uncharacterized protein (DUF362 family)